jgi:hypothetical protein
MIGKKKPGGQKGAPAKTLYERDYAVLTNSG